MSSITPAAQIDSYRIDALLGEGGMAQVYRAWHTGLQRHEALKTLLPHLAHDRQFVERFLHEARTAAGLHHPNIATIHTVSAPQSTQPYFTMQLVEGGDLCRLLQDGRRLSLSAALPLLRQTADALDYAHGRGVIHRDIKPANILLERAGDTQMRVKLVDFGIARAQQDGGGTRLTKAGMIVGTPEYMSPEQAEGRENIDYRTDIYSLGIVAYEMLCGQPPFQAGAGMSSIAVIMSHLRDTPAPASRHAPGLPSGADDALLIALAKTPAERYASCGAFVDALAACVPRPAPTVMRPLPAGGAAVGAADGARHDNAPIGGRVNRAPALVALCFVLAACSLFAGRAWQQSHDASAPPLPPLQSGSAAQTFTASNKPTAASLISPQKEEAEGQAQQAKDTIDGVVLRLQELKRSSDAGTLVDTDAARAKSEMRQQLHQALALTRSALDKDDANQKAWLERARAYNYLPDRPSAQSTLQQAIARFPNNNDLRLLKSNLDARK